MSKIPCDTVHVEFNGKVQNKSIKLAVVSYTISLSFLVQANKLAAIKRQLVTFSTFPVCNILSKSSC